MRENGCVFGREIQSHDGKDGLDGAAPLDAKYLYEIIFMHFGAEHNGCGAGPIFPQKSHEFNSVQVLIGPVPMGIQSRMWERALAFPKAF